MASQFPQELEALFGAINTMTTQLHTLLEGGLLFGDNVQAQIKSVAIPQHSFVKSPITVKHTLQGQPSGVIVLKVEDLTPQSTVKGGSKIGSGNKDPSTGKADGASQQSMSVDWVNAGSSTIQIRSMGALDREHKYQVTLMIV